MLVIRQVEARDLRWAGMSVSPGGRYRRVAQSSLNEVDRRRVVSPGSSSGRSHRCAPRTAPRLEELFPAPKSDVEAWCEIHADGQVVQTGVDEVERVGRPIVGDHFDEP